MTPTRGPLRLRYCFSSQASVLVQYLGAGMRVAVKRYTGSRMGERCGRRRVVKAAAESYTTPTLLRNASARAGRLLNAGEATGRPARLWTGIMER